MNQKSSHRQTEQEEEAIREPEVASQEEEVSLAGADLTNTRTSSQTKTTKMEITNTITIPEVRNPGITILVVVESNAEESQAEEISSLGLQIGMSDQIMRNRVSNRKSSPKNP